jgi:subfamily B ATP-binding cassette protein HlyB/CyaB
MDSGITCLCIVAKLNNIALDETYIAQQFGQAGHLLTSTDLIRAAKSANFKARRAQFIIEPQKHLFTSRVLPLIAETKDGQYIVVAKMSEQNDETRFLIHDPIQQKACNVSQSELYEKISGAVILLTKRESFVSQITTFDITWFIPAFKKYKKLFYDVLIASFFIQIFALATPLFFQVVMDKVLVHNGLNTLDVLAVGFFCHSFI